MKLFEVELKLEGLALIYRPSRNNQEAPEPIEVPATCVAYVDVAAETEDDAKRLAIDYARGDDRGLYEVQSVEYSDIWEDPAGTGRTVAEAFDARYTEPE